MPDSVSFFGLTVTSLTSPADVLAIGVDAADNATTVPQIIGVYYQATSLFDFAKRTGMSRDMQKAATGVKELAQYRFGQLLNGQFENGVDRRSAYRMASRVHFGAAKPAKAKKRKT